jgi:hypothetical protein
VVEITISPMETGLPVTMNPIIKLDPKSGPVGTVVTIRGVKFEYNKLVVIFFDNDTLKAEKTNNNGEITTTFTVPEGTTKGAHRITILQGIRKAMEDFTVTPTIETDPGSGPPGTVVQVTGTEFEPETDVDIVFEGVVYDTQTVGPAGGFVGSFTIPESDCCERLVEAKIGELSLADDSFIVTAKIEITPSSGPIGTTVTIEGQGFAMSMEDSEENIDISFDDVDITEDVTPTPVVTDEMGSFSCTYEIPVDTINGVHTFMADAGDEEPRVPFNVTSGTTSSIVLNPTTGPALTSVTVTGSGFDADGEVTIELNDELQVTGPETVQADENGDFTCNFTILEGTPTGAVEVKAITNTFNVATETFIVTA